MLRPFFFLQAGRSRCGRPPDLPAVRVVLSADAARRQIWRTRAGAQHAGVRPVCGGWRPVPVEFRSAKLLRIPPGKVVGFAERRPTVGCRRNREASMRTVIAGLWLASTLAAG